MTAAQPELPRPTVAEPAFAAAIAVSLVVNDSPVDVVVTGLVAYLAVEAYTVLDVSAAGTLARHLGVAPNKP